MSTKVERVKNSLNISKKFFNASGYILPYNNKGTVPQGSLKYMNTRNLSYVMQKFHFPNRMPIDTNYAKPNKYSIYTQQEQNLYRLQYKFIGVFSDVGPPSKLFSYAELYVGEHIVEIYNVHTDPDYRRQGIATKLLNLIKTLYPNQELWLGVVYQSDEGEKFKSKIRFYAKSGFTSNVKVTNETPSGKVMPLKFIQMKYKHTKVQTSPNIVNKTIAKAYSIVNSNLKSDRVHVLHKARFHITYSYLQKVIKALNEYKEFGGAIKFSYNGFDKTKGRFTFESEDNVSKYTEGYGSQNRVNQYMVVVPGTNIPERYLMTWHTHPKRCYLLTGSCVALPSGGDIETFFLNYLTGKDKTGINIVFATEGIYVVRLKSKFMERIEQERRSGRPISIPDDLSFLSNFVHIIQQKQFRPNISRNNIEKKLIIIKKYKNELEKLVYIGGIKIFDMFFYNYHIPSGIYIDTLIHSDTIYSTKNKTKIQSPNRVKTRMLRSPNSRFNITPLISN